MTLKRRGKILPNRKYYLGVDIARLGQDQSTFQIIDRTNENMLEQVENIVTTKTLTTDTTKQILHLDNIYHMNQIFVDAYGMGVGVFDQLLTTDQTKGKVIAIGHLSRPLTSDEKQKTRLIKEDIYNNLLMLMERGEIKLLDDPEVFQSLKSVQFEINDQSKIKYFGNYTHIAEGIVRAAWCSKDNSLDLFVRSIKV